MTVTQDRQEAGAGTKFILLMRKNFLQQWRHRIQTAVELLLPVLTMTMMLVLRSQIDPIESGTITYPAFPAHTLDFSLPVLGWMNHTHISVAYSPQNEMLEEIVKNSVSNLIYKNTRVLLTAAINHMKEMEEPPSWWPPSFLPPGIDLEDLDLDNLDIEGIFDRDDIDDLLGRIFTVQGYNRSADLQSIYALEETTRNVICAVEFDDSLHDATELPLNVAYALRFPERPRANSFFGEGVRTWRTDTVFPVFLMPGPRFMTSTEGGNDPGYVNEMFIAMQHVISMEIISRMTGEDMSSFDVNMNRYPHPPFMLDMAVEALQFLFPMFVMLSFSYTAVNIVRAITLEKELQLKETMKIMGIPTWLHWAAWFCKQFIYLFIATILIVIIINANFFVSSEGTRIAVITNTSWTVLMFFFMLYLSCTIFFCFMLSTFFSKASTASVFGGVIWILTFVPAMLLSMDGEMSIFVQVLTCFSINSAMSYGFQLLLAQESTGGLHWGEFFNNPSTDSSRLVFGHVVIMLLVDCVLYMMVALYLEQVMPGPFGTARPWYFLFQKTFWCTGGKVMDEGVLDIAVQEHEITMEKDPTHLNAGVKITNLTKKFGTFTAVDNLSLNIYDDQITVLLGHNGAGKSTTISMLTGNLDPTHGSMQVAGYDMSRQTGLARTNIGLCPQHNVLFNELTVREHLEFFSRLKGLTGLQLHEDVDTVIEKLELQDKRDYQSGGLSGGQKRRLSVGIALCGGARVVLLDEPTSGMDPASRRALWDLLQREKKGRSMILTTHFMDEADILGDRVAIMAHGRLQCVGSPYFLKQHYGIGYTLVVVKRKDFQYEACTDLINNYIPGTTITSDRGSEITYSLSNDYSHVFEAMLTDLEQNIDNINYKNYGLMTTTLEEVFMSVGSDGQPVDAGESDDGATTAGGSEDLTKYEFESSLEQLDSDNGSIEGFPLIWQHVIAIWMKLWLVWSRSWQQMLIQVLVPIVMINASLGIYQFISSFIDSIQRRALTLTTGYTSSETLLNYNGTLESSLGALARTAYERLITSADSNSMDLTVVTGQPIDQYYLHRTAALVDMAADRNRLLVGATFDDNSATAWFSNFAYHDVATSLATLHSALLQGKNASATLNVFNHPLEATYRNQDDMRVMVTMLSMQLASGIGSSLGIVSAVYLMFYIKERVSRAKLLQKAAGISPATMWASAAVFDWVWFAIICLPILLSCLAWGVIGLSSGQELGRMYACMLLYGAAMLPLCYVVSYFFNGPALGFVAMFFVNVTLGMMGTMVVDALKAPQLGTQVVSDVLDGILQFFPLYGLVYSVRLLNHIGLQVHTCMQGCEFLAAVTPGLECNMEFMCGQWDECCVEEDPHWHWAEPGVLRYLICMMVTGVVMWAVLMFAEFRLYDKIFNRERRPPPVDESTLDPDVADEARHAKQVGGEGLSQQSLVSRGMSKYYGKHLAVDQVSFSVADTEVFGLLGVNGAGKTTTFKMLMGDETISSGDAFVAGHSVKTKITKVHENIGYCPQFDAVFPELTGRETLRFFLMLRGLNKIDSYQIEALAQTLGFMPHLDKRVEQYSGGNKRKLSTAVALLGRTRLVFVDEPTTGVDPAAKRQVWGAVRSARRTGRGVVLTSHSMEECEALCSRLTIMVNGRFQCLGTPQHLKNKFSEGFTLTIKMKVDDDQPTASANEREVKDYVNSNFTNPKIMEEYLGLLTYYLPDRSVPWSRMFGIMERAKSELQIEDYSISQTTLEQIFLQFTKYQQQGLMSQN